MTRTLAAFNLLALTLLLSFCLALPFMASAKQKAPQKTATEKTLPRNILDVQAFQTPGGIEVWLVEDKNVPVISISFSFDGGLSHEPVDKPGVARLVSILLDEGAGDIKSQEFQSRLSDNAIDMDFTAGRDAFYGRLRTLRDKRDTAFSLLRLALTAPRFDDDAIVRMKNANIAKIKNDMGDPSWLVARTFNGMLFEGHIYSRPGHGHLASMAAITRGDLLTYTQAQFVRDGLKIAVAGDIGKAEAAEAIDAIFGALPATAQALPTPPATQTNAGKTIILPLDTPQTYVALGQPGIPHTDKDWPAAVIMNYILGGGGFDSRLMHEVREKRGLTYGIYSSLSSMKQATLMQVSFSSSNDKVAEALKVIHAEMTKMAAQGPSAVELENAQSYLTGSLLLELTSTGDIAATLNGLQRDGYGPDYINKRNSLLNAVTMKDIRRVAARLLKPDDMTTVLVGRPAQINADILLDRPPGMETPPQETPKP